MNTSAPEGGPNDSVEALYRRLAKLDPSEPAPATRQAIMGRARQLASSRAATDTRQTPRSPAFRWGRTAVMGALAASVVTALVIAPRYLPSGSSPARAPQAHPPRSSAANRALQMPPSATSAADMRLAPGTPASPEFAVPRAALGPSARAAAAAPAPAAKSAMPAGTEDTAAPFAAFSNARRWNRQANAALPPAVNGSLSAVSEPAQQRLRQAAEAGDLAQIAVLASQLPDLNAPDAQGRTAVMIATLHRQTAAVTALLSLGADPNAADVNGLTPLQAAREAGARDLVAALERYGGH